MLPQSPARLNIVPLNSGGQTLANNEMDSMKVALVHPLDTTNPT